MIQTLGYGDLVVTRFYNITVTNSKSVNVFFIKIIFMGHRKTSLKFLRKLGIY